VVLLLTFFLTILIDLTVAIQIGILTAAFLFLQKMSQETQVSVITENLPADGDDLFNTRDMSAIKMPEGVEAFEIYGSLFFGAVSQFRESIRIVAKKPKVIILRMRNVPTIDASGLHTLEELIKDGKNNDYTVTFSAVSRSAYRTMRKTDFVMNADKRNFVTDIFAAIERAKEIIAGNETDTANDHSP